MKKNVLLLLLLGFFPFIVSAQEVGGEESSQSPSAVVEMLRSQLKEQIGAQLKEQVETQLVNGFKDKSRKELNVAIDSMLLQLNELIEQVDTLPEDSLTFINEFMNTLSFKMDDDSPESENIFEADEVKGFYESFYSETVLMRDKLTSIRKIRNKDKKAQQLSDSFIHFFTESGLWELLEIVLIRSMTFIMESPETEPALVSDWEIVENSRWMGIARVDKTGTGYTIPPDQERKVERGFINRGPLFTIAAVVKRKEATAGDFGF